MQKALPQLKNTNNMYYKIGFASFYIKTLLVNKKYKNAVNYAIDYFNAYKKDIFEHRWHLFFCAYIQALICTENYSTVLSICRRYNLTTKENQRINRADYMPIISIYSLAAEYMEDNIPKEKLISLVVKSAKTVMIDKYRSRKIIELLNELSENMPEEVKNIKKELSEN
jgi:hypothetical protein